MRLVGVIRGGQGRVNVDGLFAQEDDILEFLVTNEGLRELHDLLQRTSMKVVIAGGGSVGTSIALDLMDRHHDVTLMEQDRRSTADTSEDNAARRQRDGGRRV